MPGAKRGNGGKVTVFYSLLILSLLETLAWSFVFIGPGSSTAAQAYYTRETENLSASAGSLAHAEFGDLEIVYALVKAEARFYQRTLDALSAASQATSVAIQPLLKGSQTSHFFTFQPETGASESDEPAAAQISLLL